MKLRFNHIMFIILIALSAIFFVLQQVLFHDLHESGFLFFQDLLFLPLEILLVTFILDKIIESREKQERLEHMNIVIGAFFSEVGTDTIKLLSPYLADISELNMSLDMKPEWGNNDFAKAADKVKSFSFLISSKTPPLAPLKEALPQKKTYLLQMFSNPNLLEHSTFTEMLWALYHLMDELEHREDPSSLPNTDIAHIGNDIIRAFSLLAYEWIYYMMHLKKRYPYLWSLAIRENPFANNDIIIR